ncbi:floral homeotic protein GLOBOSA-like isoform X3 [Euphorbia lathyris]|uniref:floral homeotic protein GLOBOSA-like isoform X3 n=1 Tax=Euphorbia lathyris TaxID=212925 RepID=UPI0033144AF1
MEIELRHLKGLDIGSMHCLELMDIERSLKQGLDGVFNQRVSLISTLILINVLLYVENLEEENNPLIFELAMSRCPHPIPSSAFNNDGSIYAYSVCYDWSKDAENHNPQTAKTYIYLHSPQQQQ